MAESLNATIVTVQGRTHKVLIAANETFNADNFTAKTVWRFMSRDRRTAVIISGANIEALLIEQK